MENESVITSLSRRLHELGFYLVSLDEKKQEFTRLGKKFPSRVTGLHHYQDMYIFEYLGYRAVVNTGIIDSKLMKPGLSWVLITKDFKSLFTRVFKENTETVSKILSDRLVAYAQLVKNIIKNRPIDENSKKLKELIEKEVSVFVEEIGKEKKVLKNFWISEGLPDEDLFSVENLAKYLEGINEYSVSLIQKREKKTNRYFTIYRTAKKFRKEIRNKSETENKENTYVK